MLFSNSCFPYRVAFPSRRSRRYLHFVLLSATTDLPDDTDCPYPIRILAVLHFDTDCN